MGKLILALKREFQSNTKCLDRHDGYGTNSRADGEVYQGILLAIFWGDLVDHDDGEHGNDGDVGEETCMSTTFSKIPGRLESQSWDLTNLAG